MPSPFSKQKPQATAPVGNPDVINVFNSCLVCDLCFEEVSDGTYFPGYERLVFTCSQGHENIVRDIRL